MADDDARKLFVAGLSDAVVDDVLKEVFAATGATHVDVNIPRDRATGRPRGFAFVILGSAEEAANARKILDGSVQGGRSIAVRPFRAEGQGREERTPGADNHSTEDRTLYIRNLPYESSRDEIAELFKSYGVEGIERVHLPVGPDGRGKGFGFVTMSSASTAQAALPLLRNASLRGRPIAANIARSRDERPTSAPSSPPMSRGGGASEFPPAPPRGEWRPEGRRESRRFDSAEESPRGEEELPPANVGEVRKEKKKKKSGGTGTDSPRTNRRQDEGFRSPRGRAQIDDWDDD